MSDPDFAQGYTVYRSSGQFAEGGFRSGTPVQIPMVGIITVAQEEDLVQVPEGDRVTGSMVFYSEIQLFETRDTGSEQGISDKILWNGLYYKLVKVFPYKDFGFWKAIGVRVKGN